MAFYINENYIDNKGIFYEGLRDIHYDDKKDLFGNLGKFVAETDYKDNIFLSHSWNLNNGIYLYQTHYDPKKALRIYKDFADYKYTYHKDDKLISELQSRQKYVKLTDFPTGVATIENYVIGQEIPYYENCDTLAKKCLNLPSDNKRELTILKYYLEILEILKELYKNDIIYADVRSRNFMIDKVHDMIKLIDFESSYISFDRKKYYSDMIDNIKIMINEINKYFKIEFIISKETSLENIEETINTEQHKRLNR